MRGSARLRTLGLAARLTLAGLTGILLVVACSPAPISERLWLFGSEARIEIRATPASRAEPALHAISQTLTDLHHAWHAWQDSDLTRINAALARGEPHPLPESIASALRRAGPLVTASEGLFDPSIGGLVALWGFHRSEFPIIEPPPDPEIIRDWLEHRPRFDDLRIEGDRIASRNHRLQLDLAAIAEGLAIERTVAILAEHGIDHALISFGGDLMALGSNDGRRWRIALRDPLGNSEQAALAWVELSDREALFSSGGYQRYRVAADGGRWPHLLDPRTGQPALGSAGTVVLHSDPVVADAAATALFIAGPEGFERMTRALGLGCALLLDDRDRLLVTTALAVRLHDLRVTASYRRIDRGEHCG